jgi:hypothetical protein
MKVKGGKQAIEERPMAADAGDGVSPVASAGPLGAVQSAMGRLGGFAVLAMIIVAGSAMLFGMRKLGMAGGVELIDIKIDYPIDAKDQASGADHRAILEDLRTSGQVVQVPSELVQMNPFEWKDESKSVETVDDSARTEQERLRKAQAAREAQLKSALAAMKLNSVMGGRVPMAQISGQLVRVGDVIGPGFMVMRIEGRTVALEVDGKEFVLALGE